MSTERAAYIAGLRALADLLEDNPDLPLPHTGEGASPFYVFARTVETALAYIRAMDAPPPFKAERSGHWAGDYTGTVKGLFVRVYVHRSVCEARTTATVEYVLPAALRAVTAGADALQEKPPADYRSQDDTQDQDGGDAG